MSKKKSPQRNNSFQPAKQASAAQAEPEIKAGAEVQEDTEVQENTAVQEESVMQAEPESKADTAVQEESAAQEVKEEVEMAETEEKTVQEVNPQEAKAAEVYLQFAGTEVAIDAVVQSVKESCGSDEAGDIKIYIKPEDNKAYYVVNGDTEGSVDLA